MERKTASHQGRIAARFCLGLVILLSCSKLPAQTERMPRLSTTRTDYWYGRGVPQDYVQAADWYRKAAEQDAAEAQYRLGQMLAIGQGMGKTTSRRRNGIARRPNRVWFWRSTTWEPCMSSVKALQKTTGKR